MITGCPIPKLHSDVTYACDHIYVHILPTLGLHLRRGSLGDHTRHFVESSSQVSTLLGRAAAGVDAERQWLWMD